MDRDVRDVDEPGPRQYCVRAVWLLAAEDREAAAAPERAGQVREPGIGVSEHVMRASAHDHVEAERSEPLRLGVGVDEADVSEAGIGRALPRLLQHRQRVVDTEREA